MEHVSIQLADFVQNRLEAQLRDSVDMHLRECAHCREELIEVQLTLSQMKGLGHPEPSQGYFASVAPRVLDRLKKRKRRSWEDNPVFSRLVLPMSAALVATAFLLNLGPFHSLDVPQTSLAKVLEGVEPDEIMELVLQDSKRASWITGQVQEVAQSVAGVQLSKEGFLQSVPALDFSSYINEDLAVTSQQLLQNLDEDQIETLIKKLEGKSIL